MDKKVLLGKRIKELRKSKKLKQEFLAEKLGIEPRQLSKLETGRHYPSFETIVKLLEVFNITFEELVSFKHLRDKETLACEICRMTTELSPDKLAIAYKILNAIL